MFQAILREAIRCLVVRSYGGNGLLTRAFAITTGVSTGKKPPDTMKVPEANKTRFDDRIYVIGETKLCIKQNTQIAYNICGRETITQDIDRK